MESYNLLPENERTEVEGRQYLVPTLPVEQTNEFIDKFRETQRGNTEQISQQTEALGTSVPSNEGGLMGAGSYFTSRYQTPQTNTALQNLRTASLLAAMQQAGKNELAAWEKRKQDAYRAYQKKQYDRSKQQQGNNGSNSSNQSGWNGELDLQSTEDILDDLDNSIENNKQPEPPKEEDFMIDGKEQTKRIQERSGLPDWLVNVLKIFG